MVAKGHDFPDVSLGVVLCLPMVTTRISTVKTAVAGVQLSRDDLADLVDRTEGWPAALYLGTLLGGTVALSSLTFYAIERPFLLLGRRLLGKNPPLAAGGPAQPAPARAA